MERYTTPRPPEISTYICCVEVADFSRLPRDFAQLSLPKRKYAVFSHRGHILAIRGTWNQIWNKWLPESGMRIVNTPRFERYTSAFNPMTGMGGLEIWIPLEP
jgi:AraC family transcriptional regulator